MAKAKVEDIRNLVLCGHGSTGKTTLVDRLLVKTGAVSANPSVDEGTSICDFDPEEKEHKYSIESAVTHFTHDGKRFNVIDAPGYPDFIGHTIGALQGVDNALVVINAQSGVEVNTRRVFQEAEEAGVGRMIVINKLDGDNIDFATLIGNIQELWGGRCVLLNVPIGHGADFKGVVSTLTVPDDTTGALVDPAEIHDALIESIIEVDEAVMEKYLEGQLPSAEELSRLISQAVASGTLIPIVCCSAKTEVGLDELLDAISTCGLSPADVTRTAQKDGEDGEIKADSSGPLVARIFKTRIDPFVQKLSFIRIYSGQIKKDETVTA
ncbi:MAG: GTP-binding protein, partial [Pirellulaceae bacterium]|nr:GTP-binding protein [Pirellulaceae bacterium]